MREEYKEGTLINKKFIKREKYTSFLTQALDNVDKEYFKILTTYDEIVRERVFCYELYHQMRLLQNIHGLSGFALSGEIDKRGHTGIETEDWKNPDFVFHEYGTFDRNEIIIEVKGKINVEGIKKDFKTLLKYASRYQYNHSFFILYNHNLIEFQEQFLGQMDSETIRNLKNNKSIVVICKKSYDSVCEVADLRKLLHLEKA